MSLSLRSSQKIIIYSYEIIKIKSEAINKKRGSSLLYSGALRTDIQTWFCYTMCNCSVGLLSLAQLLTVEINLTSCIYAHVSVFYKLTITRYVIT